MKNDKDAKNNQDASKYKVIPWRGTYVLGRIVSYEELSRQVSFSGSIKPLKPR